MAGLVQVIKWPTDGGSPSQFTAPADRIVDSWTMMSGPAPLALTIIAYLYFVLFYGPRMMEKRKPFDLKWTMVLYNLYNVVFSSWLCWQLIGNHEAIMYFYTNYCAPKERTENHLLYEINKCSWLYFISKLVELLDTVFFVLRKKQNQVTVLHVYHHVNMALSTWAYLKYIRGEQGILIGFINCFVHVVMYSYYLLAAFGPAIQKYLWWKKYITKLQLGQFILVFCYCVFLLVKDCQMPKGLSYYAVFQALVFFCLFMNFYRKAYFKEKVEKEKVKSS